MTQHELLFKNIFNFFYFLEYIIIIITLSVLKGEHYAGTTHTDSPLDHKHQGLRCLSETPVCSLGGSVPGPA